MRKLGESIGKCPEMNPLLSLKTLLRSPARTALTFVLLVVASFAFFMQVGQYAITRALGMPKGASARVLILPLLSVAAISVSAGSGAAWVYTVRTVGQTNALLALAEYSVNWRRVPWRRRHGTFRRTEPWHGDTDQFATAFYAENPTMTAEEYDNDAAEAEYMSRYGERIMRDIRAKTVRFTIAGVVSTPSTPSSSLLRC